jgi:hypothetical protein
MPTQGFNIKSLVHEGFKLNVWDVGGTAADTQQFSLLVFSLTVVSARLCPVRRPARDPAVLEELLRPH